MTRLGATLVATGVLLVVAGMLASPAAGSWDDWNCRLEVYWGELGGKPQDTNSWLGVRPGHTDGYDPGWDTSKPPEPLGDHIYAWFERPGWGQGRIAQDWRAPIAGGSSKVWGTGPQDTWNVKTSPSADDHSGYYDEGCDPGHGLEYPVAASLYVTWQFGVSYQGPPPTPPDDYTFTLIYRGGINPKPSGTKLPDAMDPPAFDTQWDMEATPQIVIPLWSDTFRPWRADCGGLDEADTAKFVIVVNNPQSPVSCTIAVAPEPPQEPPATFAFTATACCDGPFSFEWDFGDGGISTAQNPTHQYAAVGTYIVALTVTDSGGVSASCSQQVTVTIPVNYPPTCGFAYWPASPTTADPVQFSDTSSDSDGTITAWAWDFGDGGTSMQRHPTHHYAGANAYRVSLTVTDNDGASTECETSITVIEAPPSDMNWNCSLRVYWGALGGNPNDTGDYFGVKPGATDSYDLIDSKKPAAPLGEYVYTWFARPFWGQGRIMQDWRAPIADGTSKVWGTGLTDTWNVRTNKDNGPSGYFDPTCDVGQELEYPIAASVYITWAFGVKETPPLPVPPDDYTFTLQYKRGISAKPAGTKLGDATVPTINQTWDMEATSFIAVPLWRDSFTPWTTDCNGFEAADTASFKIIVYNPASTPPTCDISYAPAAPLTDDVTVFDSGAADPQGTIISVAWDFGDGSTGAGDPAAHSYSQAGEYLVCATVTDDQGERTICSTQVAVQARCQCDVAIEPTHCKLPAGPVGQCKTGQIAARNMSDAEPCEVVTRVTDNAGSVVFESDPITVGPGRTLRLRFNHCYTADEIGRHRWRWEVSPTNCAERTPRDNAYLAKVIVHR